MFYVYRFFNTAGDLLWVGQTSQLTTRFTKHWYERPWAAEIATATVIPAVDLEDALTAETEAIKTENPKYNKIDGGDPHSRFHPGYGICPRCGGPKPSAKIWACNPCIKEYRRERRAAKGIESRKPPVVICPRCQGPKDPGPSYCKKCKIIVNREYHQKKALAKRGL
jgi:hypothetical protein